MALIAGMIVTWLQKIEKLSRPSAAARSTVIAVDGAVVSNPIAMNTTRLSGFLPGDLQRVQRRVDHPDVGARGLGVEERPAPAGHPHHVAERSS